MLGDFHLLDLFPQGGTISVFLLGLLMCGEGIRGSGVCDGIVGGGSSGVILPDTVFTGNYSSRKSAR